MLKRWCSIKKIKVCLLCEILISKDTPQGQKEKNCWELTKIGATQYRGIFAKVMTMGCGLKTIP